ncbi:hypothetical protein [Pontibacter sp. G13]|uniref:hypothetical protein n=1 Tax=Pontibacter sp. G13 TaxID=3074898 RepID=UPI00288A3AB4|nr:hypothetical protein [Pontibacter sp. G13]WNJ19991.1 hypothetical protein RJD25_05865 [Pontibacter sp. G13]
MKNLLRTCLLTLVVASTPFLSQAQKRQHAIHVDIGTLVLMSNATLNYETQVAQFLDGAVQFNVRTGVGWAVAWESRYVGPILTGVFLTGVGSHHFEVNLGVSPAYDYESARINRSNDPGTFDFMDHVDWLPIGDVGYRYQKPEGGFIFRAKGGTTGVGVGIGWAFEG